jgi:hypothetical protein
MKLIDFYLTVIKSFNANKVEYLIVGGHAVNYYGFVRSTLDMDIWISTRPTNLDKLYKSFIQLGYDDNSSKEAINYLLEKHIINISVDKSVIDLIDASIVREDFDRSYKNHNILIIENVEIKIIGLIDLINCKKKSNRPKDLLDVKELMDIKKLEDNK